MGDHRHRHDPGERLYVPGDSAVHRLPAHTKIVAAFVTVLAVVLTPPTAVWAFGCYAVLLLGLVLAAGLTARDVLPRLVIEVPFIAFAVLLPFVGRDPRVAVGPLELSEPGLWAAWGIIAKATAGIVVSIVLAATTPTRDLIDGLQRLRLPAVLVQIVASMVRYVHVVTDEWRRMARARAARGFTARGPRSWPVLAHSAGTLFIRSYERGERVHLAMLSRGYSGQLPPVQSREATAPVASAALVPGLACLICVAALVVAR